VTAPLALPGLERAAGVVCEHLERGQRRVTLYGRESSGKTSTMRLIADRLQADAWRVRRTQMTSDDDGALVALATLGADLGDEVRRRVFDVTVPWKQKLQAVVHGLESPGGRTAVLVDDPWFGSPEEAPSLFAERSVDLLDEIERTPSLSLVLSRSDRPLAGTIVELPTAADPRAVLAAERWQRSSLEHVARELAESGDSKLARLSPVELRLAVALASVKGMNGAEALRRLRTGPHAFVRAVLDALGSARFRSAMVRLGVMRTPFDEATLDELLGETSMRERGLVLDALLFRTDDGFVVPELLARAAKERLHTLRSVELKQAHLVAVRFHERGFAENSDPASVSGVGDLRSAKRHEMEIIHHLTEAGDADAVFSRSVYFVEQYDKLGKALSIRGIRTDKPAFLQLAVDAYDRALAHDREDAYAHHYRAYNLDVLAEGPGLVEEGYRRALALRPDHVWHHGRFISFLVTCGRPREAHDAWEEALRALDGLRGHAWLFRELHRPVARLLLHRGRLEFAREALDDVPERLGDTWLAPTRALLGQLEEAEADQLVFPVSVAPEGRWEGPHLLVAEEERTHVVRWMPGRIERANGDIVVRFAEYAEPTAKFGRRTYTAAKFRRVCPAARPTMPAAGTFLEILELDGEDHEMIRCHPMTTALSHLPPLFPPPDRYL
jgi:tetratricopeptide (TPR) repeat protein